MSEFTPEYYRAFEEANSAYERLAMVLPKIPLVREVSDHGDFSPGLAKQLLEEILSEQSGIARERVILPPIDALIDYRDLANRIYFDHTSKNDS